MASAEDDSVAGLLDAFSDLTCTFLDWPLNDAFHDVPVLWTSFLVLCVLQWHLRFVFLWLFLKCCSGEPLRVILKYCFPNRYMRIFGRNVLVLYIYFHSNLQQPFLWMAGLAVLDNFILGRFVEIYKYFWNKRMNGATEEGEPFTGDKKNPSVEALEKGTPVNNWYKDFSKPFDRVLVAFFAQASLMGFFMFFCITDEALNEKVAEEQSDIGKGSHFSKIMWVISILLSVISGNEDAKALNNYWHHAYFAIFNASTTTFKVEFCLRCVFDLFINNIFHCIVRAMTPLVMPFKDLESFFTGVLGLFFICEMDDLGPDTFEAMVQNAREHSTWFEDTEAYQNKAAGEGGEPFKDRRDALLKEWFGGAAIDDFWKPKGE